MYHYPEDSDPTRKRLTRAELLDDMSSEAFGGWRIAAGSCLLGLAVTALILWWGTH